MPRVYKHSPGPRRNLTYPQSNLEKAVEDVGSGKLSMRGAAEKWEIPKSTLHDLIKQRNSSYYGGQSALSIEEEEAVVKGLCICAEWGFPLRAPDVRNTIKSYLERRGKIIQCFKDNRPGRDWIYSFLKRHPDLTVKMCENIKRVRAQVSENILCDYFNELEKSLQGVSPECIINYDETNFCDDPGLSKVIVRRGLRHADRIVDSSKVSTSVMMAVTASGELLPPYTVYKAEYLYDPWIEGGVQYARYNCNSSGWFDMEIYEDWFFRLIVPYFRRLPGPKLLIGDNLSSHLSLRVIEKCEELNIRFVLLPPNSTHLCQPLDVAFFRPLKIEWRKTLLAWKMKNRGVLPKNEFPKMLRETLENIGHDRLRVNAVSGFKACGILPLNKEVVLCKLPQRHPSDNRIGEIWAEVLVGHLNTMRSGERAAPRGRGRRKSIQAGRSVSVNDLIDQVMEEEGVDNPSETSVDTSVEETECDASGPNGQEKQLSSEQLPSASTSTEVANTPSESEMPTPNDFVLVNLPFDGCSRGRLFVGKVLSVADTDDDQGCAFKIKFMRKKVGQKEICFVFPPVNDIDTVVFEHVKKKIHGRDIRRGRFVFPAEDLSLVQ